MLDTSSATWPEVRDQLKRKPVAVIAVGAQEEHGPHLPLSTDTVQSAELARRLAEALDLMLLPYIPYGDSWGVSGFPGTVSISFNTIYALLIDIGNSLLTTGFKAIIVVNGHFGNHAPLELAVRDLTTRHHLPSLLLDYPGMAEIAGEVCESKPAAPTFFHADEFETSMMLALRPEAVHMDKAQAEYPVFPPTYGAESILIDTFNESGVFGDPRPATAEKGERILEMLTQENLRLANVFLDKLGV